jgi:hypothetical protein
MRKGLLLDLIITNEPDMMEEVGVYGGGAGSDYNLLFWTTDVCGDIKQTEQRMVDYRKANQVKIREESASTGWNSLIEAST